MEFTDKDRSEARLYSLKHMLDALMSRTGNDDPDLEDEVAAPEKPAEGVEEPEQDLDSTEDEAPEEASEEEAVDHKSDDDDDMMRRLHRRLGR
jgi:spore germination cell wall hydrolase CwlJ-like protein